VLPPFTIGKFKFKKIDLLADIKTQPHDSTVTLNTIITDSVQTKIDSVSTASKSICPTGITCIEDYSGDSTALLYYTRALHNLKANNKTVRIAMYGDSFIEGDVLCGSFRDTLQQIYGGVGVGFVPITSEVAGFRRNIKHKFENWETYSLVSKKDTTLTPPEFGPAGFCYVPLTDNWVEYKPVKQHNIKEFNTLKLYYKNYSHASVAYTLNDDTVTLSEDLKTSGRLQEWRYRSNHISSVRFQFPQTDSLYLYGASFENNAGIYVDNFSVRGNSGLPLTRIPDDILKKFNEYRNYKLILLQYGLNVVQEDSMNYEWYAVRMIKVINKIKKDFPKASILLIGVSDRSSNTTGKFQTMKAIPAMRNAQRYIAQETGIAFWDLYQAMGGENSMVKFVESKPSLAAKDYTHLTFSGGRKLAGMLAKSLLYEQKKYDKKKK
jgi:lysophospholipase L1-like esterase